MGVCPGQAPITMEPFFPLGIRDVLAEEDSASCVTAVFVQSTTAIQRANYAFLSKLPLRHPLKLGVVIKINSHVRLW